jgi:hypothetical protein
MKIPALPSILLLALVTIAAPSLAAAADKGFSIEKTASGGAIVKYDGKLVTEYVVDQANKPYLFPVIPPHGTPMTRADPMQKVDGEQWDHPHHRGICLGHEAENGFDTWAEKTTFEERKNDKKSQERLVKVGAQKHREFKELKAEGDKATIVSVTDHNNPQGKKEFEDTRTIVFQVIDGRLVIDYDVTFKATDAPVTFEDRKDAGFSIRVPTSMAVAPEKGKKSGSILNSEGHKDTDAWGKNAKWCDYYGPVKGKVYGVAMLNHPKSFRYPTPWHVRDYGLFTANPFGTKNLNKEAADGTFTLKPGETMTLRHRLIFHEGDTASAKIDEAFAAYEKLP